MLPVLPVLPPLLRSARRSRGYVWSRGHAWTAVGVALAVFATACGGAVEERKAANPTDPAPAAYAPYSDTDNCGVTTSYDRPPKRAATLTSNATELMLELGLADRMVGTSYLKGRTIGDKYKEQYGKIPVLAEAQPSLEKLLEATPDFVYAGYPDGFSESSGHTRARLGELGVKTHLNPEGCAKSPVTFDQLFGELRSVGGIFGVSDRAETSVAALRARLDAVKAKVAGAPPVKVFVYNSGADAAQTTGGNSMLNEIIARAGGTNVFADLNERWTKVSWEQVAERKPDVVLIYDYVSPSVDSKIETLKSTPVLADVPAIRANAFPVISLSVAQPGPRSVDAVEELATRLHPQGS
ncbi:ABC transporter substrate-binding protein [Streptomyces sp. SID3343]|uniref:ABC transporter substrate-binding protein n=1 Tax=Streptomyces sp. SID3343 TaxID=2690260 RepID=UPI0019251C29